MSDKIEDFPIGMGEPLLPGNRVVAAYGIHLCIQNRMYELHGPTLWNAYFLP